MYVAEVYELPYLPCITYRSWKKKIPVLYCYCKFVMVQLRTGTSLLKPTTWWTLCLRPLPYCSTTVLNFKTIFKMTNTIILHNGMIALQPIKFYLSPPKKRKNNCTQLSYYQQREKRCTTFL